MALLPLNPSLPYSNALTNTLRQSIQRPFVPSILSCMAITSMTSDQTVPRRSGNYMPPVWDHDYLQSLGNISMRNTNVEKRVKKLKEETGKLLNETKHRIDQFELIDSLLRLGISHHFDVEIENIIKEIYNNYKDTAENSWNEDLYATALEFRLLRQHGFNVSQEMFDRFKDETGRFKTSLGDDINGILSLYEASYLTMQGETTLKEARNFATEVLKNYLMKKRSEADGNEFEQAMVSHALEMPFHWRMRRLESRWFIDVYRKKQDMNPLLLEFAALDFNILQSVHQEDLKFTSSWWTSTGLGKKLNFARDRITENYMWSVGLSYEPQFGYFRQMLTKVTALITTMDDVYDVYGTLEELELFTETVERWDVNGLDDLPEYMRLYFLVLFNDTNQMGSNLLRDTGFNAIPYLRRSWMDLCKAFLLEAKWYHSGYKPSFREYMEIAWVTASGTVILIHAFCLISSQISKQTLDSVFKHHRIIRWSSTIFRLANDLASSSEELKRGDVSKSIQCHMHETGVSEPEAREYINRLINDMWDKMNEERILHSFPFSRCFVELAMNMARMAHCTYQYGDGHSIPDKETKNRIQSLFIQPIPLHRSEV